MMSKGNKTTTERTTYGSDLATKELQTHVSAIQTQCDLIEHDICTSFKKSKTVHVTPEDIKNCGKLLKEKIADYLLKMIKLSNQLCHSDYICTYVNQPNVSNNSVRLTEIETKCTKILSELDSLKESNTSKPHPTSYAEIDICEELLGKQKSQLDVFANKISEFEQKLNNLHQTDNESNNMFMSNSTHQPIQIPPHDVSNIVKGVHHIEKYEHHFNDDSSCKLVQYFDSLSSKFIKLNGRSVLSFGEPYPYAGAPKETPEPIPEIIQEIISKIEETYTGSGINSCLINKYEGESSFLPEHSDDEPIINPDSNIFTVSVGAKHDIIFINRHSNEVTTLSPENGSLYVMSRPSQNIWSHEI